MQKEDKYEHRGRFQAQGGDLEESEPWAQSEPLTVVKALRLLKKLILKLTKKDYEVREKAFGKAEKFVSEAGKNGGIFVPVRKTFRVKGSKDKRVDIEVQSGHAFIKDENDNKK